MSGNTTREERIIRFPNKEVWTDMEEVGFYLPVASAIGKLLPTANSVDSVLIDP